MDVESLIDETFTDANIPDSSFIVIPIPGSVPHTLFLDCTHDNKTPHQLRTAEDTLSNASLVAMSTCAIGSVRGYDEIYPNLIDLVGETRQYKLETKYLNVGISRGKLFVLYLSQKIYFFDITFKIPHFFRLM